MTDRFRLADQVHARKFDDELVILNLVRGEYFSLNAVGAAIWDRLTRGLSVEEAAQDLSKVYDVELETLRKDIEGIAHELVAQGLLDR